MASVSPSRDRSGSWGVLDAAVVLVGAQIVALLWAGVAIGLLWSGDVPDPLTPAALVVLTIGLWAGYGLGSLLVSTRKGQGPEIEYGAVLRRSDLAPGIALGIGTQVLLLPVLYLLIGPLVDADPGESARELIGAVDGPLDLALILLSVVVMAPLVEELFFRGLLLQSLARRFGDPVGIVVSAALFAAVHIEWAVMPGLFVFGIITAVITRRSGRLGLAWAMHAAFNLTTVVLIQVGWG
ncbi:MAG: type II CAAX endopeptidase family protein [Actinomycetota bacterium]